MNKVIKSGSPPGAPASSPGARPGYPAPPARPGQPAMPAMTAQQAAEYYQQQGTSAPPQAPQAQTPAEVDPYAAVYNQEYGQQGAYAPQQGAYAPQQGAYAPQQGAYAPQQGAYAPQQGAYAPQQGGYGSYPPPPVPAYQEPESPDVISARATTQKQIENVRKELEQKREDGRQNGRDESLQESRDVIQQALEIRDAFFAPIEEELIKLAKESAIKIIETLVEQNPETIISIIAEALSSAMRYQKEIYVRVNPADYQTLVKRKNDLLMRLSRARDLDIRSDESISRGGFRIDSEIGTIEATLQQQMEALNRAFEEARWL